MDLICDTATSALSICLSYGKKKGARKGSFITSLFQATFRTGKVVGGVTTELVNTATSGEVRETPRMTCRTALQVISARLVMCRHVARIEEMRPA